MLGCLPFKTSAGVVDDDGGVCVFLCLRWELINCVILAVLVIMSLGSSTVCMTVLICASLRFPNLTLLSM